MKYLEQNYRLLVIVHLAASLFMVGLIWTIQYVHYPLFAYVGETTYASFQAEHVERIGRLLIVPWLSEGVTLIGIFAIAFIGKRKELRVLAVINAVAMAVVLVLSGFWSAPAHAKLADGFDESVHQQLMTVNLIRTFAWTVCGICAVLIVLSAWARDHTTQQNT